MVDNKSKSTNKALLQAKKDVLIGRGRKMVLTSEELKKFPKGSLISFEDDDGMFQKGGILTSIHSKYFKIICDLYSDEKPIKIKFNNIKSMYVGNPYETCGDTISIREHNKKKTKYAAYIGKIGVYYAREAIDFNRYLNTQKYKNMVKWYEKFGQYFENSCEENMD